LTLDPGGKERKMRLLGVKESYSQNYALFFVSLL
jgi:hypothetical protein